MLKTDQAIDGIGFMDFSLEVRAKWPMIKSQLEKGEYRPMAVKRVKIPKANGGVRLLGIPTYIAYISLKRSTCIGDSGPVISVIPGQLNKQYFTEKNSVEYGRPPKRHVRYSTYYSIKSPR